MILEKPKAKSKAIEILFLELVSHWKGLEVTNVWHLKEISIYIPTGIITFLKI